MGTLGEVIKKKSLAKVMMLGRERQADPIKLLAS